MTMIFEPEDLAVASPATVSRCGMIFMEPSSLGFDPIVQSWISRLPPIMLEDHQDALQVLFARWFANGASLLRRFLFEPFPTVTSALLQSLLNLIDCFLVDLNATKAEAPKRSVLEPSQLEAIFVFAFVWSVASTVDSTGRRSFDVWVRSHYNEIPPDGAVYDFLYDINKSKWVPWMETVPHYECDSSTSFDELIIPTLDSVRYTFLLDTLLHNEKHMLMTGPTGTGKTVNVSRHLQTGLHPDRFAPICVTFSAQTSANQVQDLIDSKCEKRRKGVFGPTAGKKFVLFVDDVNMPAREEYGAQPPIELLRQWFDSGGWYDRKARQFRHIIDVVMVCACGPPGGGRNPLSARFPRHFNIVGYTPMQDESMRLIFNTILGSFLESNAFPDEVRAMLVGTVDATIDIYNTILTELRPTPNKSHYLYNLRDVSKVFQGMLMVAPESITRVDDMADLFSHENHRVFSDRLIHAADHNWFDNLVTRAATTHLGEQLGKRVDENRCIFSDFMVPGADPRLYQRVRDEQKLQPIIEDYLAEHNHDSKQPMQLVMFMDAIQHVARISRIIRQPKGNALLLGVGGSGRQSLAKLAAFMADYTLSQIEISKGYGISEWRENLKDILLNAGLKAQPIVFIFSDSQIVFQSMLEDLNNVLNTGDVPNLYGVEDLEAIATACKHDCAKKRIPPTKLNVFTQYIRRVQTNIHLVLCMSPLGEAFRTRLRKFPSIGNCCFPTDHELLTNHGFISLDDLTKWDCQDDDLLFASYDRVGMKLLYERAKRIVVNEPCLQELVEFTSAAEAHRWEPGADEYGDSTADKENKGNHEHMFAGFAQPYEPNTSSAISILATGNHNMFVRLGELKVGGTQNFKGKKAESKCIAEDYRKVRADACLDADLLQFSACVQNGRDIRDGSPPSRIIDDIFSKLRLSTEKQREGFFLFYGYWLVNGFLKYDSHDRPCAVACIQRTHADARFLNDTLATCGISFAIARPTHENKSIGRIHITDQCWIQLFFDEYTRNQRRATASKHAKLVKDGAGSSDSSLLSLQDYINGKSFVHCVSKGRNSQKLKCRNSSAGRSEFLSVKATAKYHTRAKSKKRRDCTATTRLFWWAQLVKQSYARCIVSGCCHANGLASTTTLHVTSASLRDSLVQLMIHAGYSVRFTKKTDDACAEQLVVPARKDKGATLSNGWEIHFSDKSAEEPILRTEKEVRRVAYYGRTWCAEMPSGFVIVRRAYRSHGIVSKASVPTIQGNCTIDWFGEWPDDALRSVATSTLTSEDLCLNEHLKPAVSFVKHAHVSVARTSERFLAELGRHNFVTPTSYLELLATYKRVLGAKREKVGTLKTRLQVGLDKLISTATQVEALQVQLTDMEPQLIKTQGEVEAMIVSIDADKHSAAETQTLVSEEEASARKKEAETKSIADDAQRDLDEALPALDEAVRCLNSLKKSDIDEVRTMGKPPSGVKLTMEACCIMFSVKPDIEKDPGNPGKKVTNYFKAAQREILSLGQKLIDKMKGYDKDNIPTKIISQIAPYVAMDEFQPSVIEKASKACTAMCMWVRAMHKYHEVSVMVEPKKRLLAEAQQSLASTQTALAKAQAKLQDVMDKIYSLEAAFAEASAKKEQLARDVDECRARLVRAKKLIGGLGGERTRWTESCAKLEVDYANLVGDSMVAAATIAYAGPFTPEFRRELVSDWQTKLAALNLPNSGCASSSSSTSCDIRATLSDPVAIRTWTLHGLPQDGHSIENGIIIQHSRRFPLLIDPQGQANRYIKSMGRDASLAENGLEVTKLSTSNFLRAVENALRFGRWILVENIGETLDASLEPLLLQQKFSHGGQECIRLGDSTIPWNASFRFFLTTKIASPAYPPEVCVKVSVINFAITPSGLEDQLLGVVVSEERPDLAEKKSALVVNNAQMKKTLADIENTILFMLSNSTGNILDDEKLITTLASSKLTSEDITGKVSEAETTEVEIDESRERYRPVAQRATTLYFAVTSLQVVSPMYQYSLQWFTDLFVQSIRLSESSDDLDDRLAMLDDYFLGFLFENVSRSLFEKHKLFFSFLLALELRKADNMIDRREWQFLISGKAAIPHHTAEDIELHAPEDDWVDARIWTEFQQISKLVNFKGLAAHFCSKLSLWKRIFDSQSPETEPLPAPWRDKLDTFQRLCVLRCLRADKIPDGVMQYVIESLGKRFVEPPPFDLELSARAASATTPFVFVLTKGSDPTKAFDSYCTASKFDGRTFKLSLGQGQGPKASKLLEDGCQKGAWIYLQNCHLFVSWLVDLEKFCESLSAETTHKDFRLWLTSMPCTDFPVSILQNAVKVTNEPPKGLKANLKSVFFKLDDDKLKATSKPDVYRKMLFALAFFHASVQERRKFGPLGWNVPYDFNETDLDISKGQLEFFLDSSEEVPFRVLRFLTSYINYGGRVTDYIDLRTIDVIMRSFYSPEMLQHRNYAFDGRGIYKAIEPDPNSPHTSYMAYIESLPLVAPPTIFGMHENAAISYMLTETFQMFDTFLSIGGRRSTSASSSSSNSQEEIVAREIETMSSKLAQRGRFNLDQVVMRYPVVYEESMNTVLAQECIRYNKLVDVMQITLPELGRALKGLIVMSNELESMASAIAVAVIPTVWAQMAYPSLKKLGPWTDDLMARLDFINSWIEHGIPSCFWISGFYFPQAFLTGSLQNFARANCIPIDTLSFDFIALRQTNVSQIETKPKDGVYVRGLFLEGARWDFDLQVLGDSRPKQLYSPAPFLHFSPVRDRIPPSAGFYRCPVYKILSRRGTLSTTGHSTNFIMWIELPSNRKDGTNNTGCADQLDWVKAGVATFCSLKF